MEEPRDLSRPKHTVFLSSSDEDEEIPLKKLRFDSTKDYEKKSEKKKKSSTKEASPIDTVMNISRCGSNKEKSEKKSDKKKKSSEFKEVASIDSVVNKSKYDSEEKIEKKSKTLKHPVPLPSSDKDEKKSMPNESRKKKKKSDRKESSTKEECPIDLEMKKSKSDSKDRSEKNSELPKHIVSLTSSDEDDKKSMLNESRKKKKKSDKKESSTKEDSPFDPVVKISKLDSKEKSKKNSELPKQTVSLTSSDEDDKKSMLNESRKKKKKSDKKKSSTREASLIDSENCSHDVNQNEEPSSEEDSQIESVKNTSRMHKRNETPMKCIICKEYSTFVVNTLITHVKMKHATTFGLAGIFLLCVCGQKSQSNKHLSECKIGNYTMIRVKDGPIQTFHDKVTPQCILCEVYPRTSKGYAKHIVDHHKSTLKLHNRYVLCSCGFKILSHHSDPVHKAKCDGRRFTLHKLAENLTIPTTQ